MHLRYRFRVYPTRPQRGALARVFGSCRVVFNDAVAARKAAHAARLPGLDERAGSPLLVSQACALAVWALTVWAVYLAHRRGYRGPAETLLRRLTNGRKR